MGKRSKNFYKMMDMMRQSIAAASAPSEWDIAYGNEIRNRQNRSTADIMSDNLGTVADWQRRYQAGATPDSAVRNKGYQMQLGMARDLGAREIARDYGRLGSESVRDYRNQTLGMIGNAQQQTAQRMWNAVSGYQGAAQGYSSFRPGGGWFEGLQKAIGLGSQVASMLFGGGR